MVGTPRNGRAWAKCQTAVALQTLVEEEVQPGEHGRVDRLQPPMRVPRGSRRRSCRSYQVVPSQAKAGAISCIVPMVSHVDYTEHDIVTE